MKKLKESVILRSCRRFSAVAVWFSIAAGLLVLIGWWLDIPGLTRLLPNLVTMKPNTALCFILAGIALWLLRNPASDATTLNGYGRFVARTCAVVVAMIGLLSFLERISDRDLGIDLLLFRGTLLATPVPHPGLMAAASGIAFLLLGCALISLDWEPETKSEPSQALAFGAVVIGFVALLGYIYGVEFFFGPAGYSAVAINTAVILVVLGTGIACARPDRGIISVLTSERLGGLMARRLAPISIVLSLLVGWLRMRGQEAGLYQPQYGAALFSGGYIVLLVVLIWICALWLNRADLARSRAEERDEAMAAIVDSSSDAIVGKALDGTITSWNKGAERIYGYRADEVVGKNVNILIPAGHHDNTPQLLDSIRRGFPIDKLETIRCRKDKALIYVSLTISPIHDREGNVIGASSVARDITAQKQAEERLNQSQMQLKGIIDSAMDAVITVDQTQQIVMFNAAAEKMFGYGAAEVVGFPLECLIPSRMRKAHEDHVRNFGNTGTTSRAMGALGALRGLRKDGSEFPIEASISQVLVERRKFFTAIVRDVTERENAAALIRQSQAQLKGIIESAMDALISVDEQQKVVMFNIAAEKMFGCSASEAIGSHLNRFIPERFRHIQSISTHLAKPEQAIAQWEHWAH